MSRASSWLFRWIVLCAVCHYWNVNAAETTTSPDRTGTSTLTALTPITDSFKQQAQKAIESIPAPIRQLVESSGWRVQLAEFVVDAQPELCNDQPRGWPANYTWQNTDAIHFPAERLLILAEKRRNLRGETVVSSRVGGVLRHEMGHAFDMASAGAQQFRSASNEFRAAYAADLQAMPAAVRKELGYYLQDSDAGRQEAFAEAFGIALGGGSDVPHREKFLVHFPHVLAEVKRVIELADGNKIQSS